MSAYRPYEPRPDYWYRHISCDDLALDRDGDPYCVRCGRFVAHVECALERQPGGWR